MAWVVTLIPTLRITRAVASGAHEIARLKMDVDGVRAYRLDQFQGALAESRIAMATGTRDARLLAHAGAIELANGDVADGRRDLQAALALGPALDPLTTAEATRLLATS